MFIKQTYLRRLPAILSELEATQMITPILKNPERFLPALIKAGFSKDLTGGEAVLPSPKLSPRARFNSMGRNIIHRDLPKEEASRMHYWTYVQRHGTEEVEVEDSKLIFYMRYPRTFVEPPSMRLTIARTASGDKIIVAPSYAVGEQANLINSINLMLVIGQECELVDSAGEPIILSPEISLDWEVLPEGQMPWERVKSLLKSALPQEGSKRHGRVLKRIEFLEGLKPDFHAKGQAGYAGYLVFGFSEQGLFVCESTELNNATYIFGDKWKAFTRLTKAEVIDGNFAKARVLHWDNWEKRVVHFLNK